MIREYALDPAIITGWKSFRHIAQGIGVSRGRTIAAYPTKGWKRMVHEQIRTVADEQERKNLIDWFQDHCMRAMSVRRLGSQFFKNTPFITNAALENAQQPFDAIIADAPASMIPPILPPAHVSEGHPLWQVERQKVIERRSASFASSIAQLLSQSRRIRFVDPYFQGDSDQIRIIMTCLSCFAASGKSDLDQIEIHVNGDKVGSELVRTIITPRLSAALHAGLPMIRIVRWQSAYVHNRFILTERGGFTLGDSLRENLDRPDQLTLLEDRVFQYWSDYHDSELRKTRLSPP